MRDKEENLELITGVAETKTQYVNRLEERLLELSVDVIRFVNTLPKNYAYKVFIIQLSKSATSIGANYEEAQNCTLKEFLQKVRIALREANETRYWLRILDKLKIGDENTLAKLLKEVSEIRLILGSIAAKVDRKLNPKN